MRTTDQGSPLSRTALIGCSIAVLAAAWRDNGNSVPRVVEATKFILRDASGTIRAEIGMVSGMPSITLLDDNGLRRGRVTLSNDGTLEFHTLAPNGSNATSQAFPINPSAWPLTQPGTSKPEKGDAQRNRAPLSRERYAAAELHYRQLCIGCHGKDGHGRRTRQREGVPDFTDADWQRTHSDARLIAGILNGRGEEMPAFADRLSAAEVRDLIVLIRAFGPLPQKDSTAPADEFDLRLRELQRRWEELDRQLKELSNHSARDSGSAT